MKINIALIFEDNVSTQLETYSQTLGGIYNSNYTLGVNSIPHITVVQTECKTDDLGSIWDDINQNITGTISVDFSGLCLFPSSSSEVWFEIPTLKSVHLSQLQNQLLDLKTLKDRKIFNGLYDLYRPHITVGLISNFNEVEKVIPTPYDLLRKKQVTTFLSIGSVGENFTYTKILKI